MTTQDAIDRLADWLREKTAGLRYQFAPARANSEKTDEERKLVAPVVYAGNFQRRVSRHTEEGEKPEEELKRRPPSSSPWVEAEQSWTRRREW